MNFRKWNARFWVIFGCIVFKAICLLSYLDHSPFVGMPVMDSAVYVQWALKIHDEGWMGREIFYRAPLYPYFLSLILRVTHDNLLPVYLIQSAMGIWMVGRIHRLAAALISERAAHIAAVAAILYAPLTFYETKILPTTLGLVLEVAALEWLVRAGRTQKVLDWATGAAFLGLTILCMPQFILTWPILIAVTSIRYRRAEALGRILASILIIPALLIGIVTVRNYIVSGDFVLISANAGVTFAQGNNSTSLGSMSVVPGLVGPASLQREMETRVAEDAAGRKLRPLEVNSYWFQRGLDFIREHPLDYLKLLEMKIALAFNSVELPGNYLLDIDRELTPVIRLAFLPFGVIAALAICGLSGGFRRGTDIALPAAFFGSFICLLMFYVNTRYRMPMIPPLLIFAAAGAEDIFRNSKSIRATTTRLILAGVVFIFSLPAFIPFSRAVLDRGNARHWHQLGTVYAASGNSDRARWAFYRARALDPAIRIPTVTGN